MKITEKQHPRNMENKKIWGIKNHREVINKRLKEIDKKDINHLQQKAEDWGMTLIDKDLLSKLQDFNFWKEWKNKK